MDNANHCNSTEGIGLSIPIVGPGGTQISRMNLLMNGRQARTFLNAFSGSPSG